MLWRDFIAGTSLADPATRLRVCTPEDDGFCRVLFHEQRQAQFAPLGLSDALLSVLLDQQYRAQQAGYARDYPKAEILMIENRRARVGRLVLALDGDTLHLVDIAIVAAARRRGIGSVVIGGLLHAAPAMGAARCSLSVLASNLLARQLYERLGFVGKPGGDAHLQMIKLLK